MGMAAVQATVSAKAAQPALARDAVVLAVIRASKTARMGRAAGVGQAPVEVMPVARGMMEVAEGDTGSPINPAMVQVQVTLTDNRRTPQDAK